MSLMTTPLAVTPSDLARLSPDAAVELLRRLLWAEADSAGIATNLINAPSAIMVSDGGIDAEVQGSPVESGQGVIKKGTTYYQVKTGDFNLSQDANVRDILCKPHRPGHSRELNTRVKSCLDKGGTFVAVLFGWDDPEKSDGEIIKKLQDKKYPSASVEVWRQNQIAGFLEPYLGLRLAVLGAGRFPFLTHDTWSDALDMGLPWHPGQDQEDLVESIRNSLRSRTGAVHVRVIGEPGIGKTRAVLEATRQADLAPLTVPPPCPRVARHHLGRG
jgi:hypothetical protein